VHQAMLPGWYMYTRLCYPGGICRPCYHGGYMPSLLPWWVCTALPWGCVPLSPWWVGIVCSHGGWGIACSHGRCIACSHGGCVPGIPWWVCTGHTMVGGGYPTIAPGIPWWPYYPWYTASLHTPGYTTSLPPSVRATLHPPGPDEVCGENSLGSKGEKPLGREPLCLSGTLEV